MRPRAVLHVFASPHPQAFGTIIFPSQKRIEGLSIKGNKRDPFNIALHDIRHMYHSSHWHYQRSAKPSNPVALLFLVMGRRSAFISIRFSLLQFVIWKCTSRTARGTGSNRRCPCEELFCDFGFEASWRAAP
jgi:hypothetical protein